jgi:hypothetical protein
MNSFINIFFIFIFIFGMLFCKIPNVNNRNTIVHKVIIFGLLFIYQFSLLVISYIKNKCKIEFLEIFRYSVETAIVGVVGYSLFNDLKYSSGSGNSMMMDDKIKYLYIAMIISLLLVFVNTVKLMFGFRPYECVKYT